MKSLLAELNMRYFNSANGWGIIFNSEAMLDIIIVLAGFYLFCGIVRVLLGGFGKSDYQRDR